MSNWKPLVPQPDGTLVTYNYQFRAPNPEAPLSTDVYRIGDLAAAIDQKLYELEQKTNTSATRSNLHQEYQLIGIL